ncbi:MAG: NAD(P)H-dependent oxidoreductase [Pseudomonadota bacterium]
MTSSILVLNSSARTEGSVTRQLVDQILDKLEKNNDIKSLNQRDLDTELTPLTASWLGANFTPAEKRTEDQQDTLKFSDALISEVQAADTIIIGAPIYNFGIPGVLKLWIDQICRAGVTFQYTENGPIGLLEGKRAIIVVASGGTKIGSEIDYATPYIKHVLGFIGIHDVTFVGADALMQDQDEAMKSASKAIEQLAA